MKHSTTLFHWDLPHPIIVSSGPLSANATTISSAFKHGAAAVVTKTISTENKPNQGIIHCSDTETFNMEGYSSRTVSDWVSKWHELKGLPVVANFHATNADEAATLAVQLENVGAEVLELGVSCPTFGDEPICFDINILRDFCTHVRKTVKIPVIAKILISMSKNYNREMVKCICDCGMDGIALSDSLPASLFVDGSIRHGGLTGTFAKSLVMRTLLDIQDYDICKIAIGGVFNSQDVFDYLNCGATAVGVCTSILKGGWVQLQTLIEEYMQQI